jgi:hypothetical protein
MATGVTTHGSIERSIQELIAHDSRELCSIIDKDVIVRIFCNRVILEPYLMTRYIITHEIEAERFFGHRAPRECLALAEVDDSLQIFSPVGFLNFNSQ